MRQRLRAILHSLEGVDAETLYLSIGLALVLGVFPMYGCPTLLCATAAIVLRLNLPAMQLVNALTSPLQLALLVPFQRLGALLLPGPLHGAAISTNAGAWQFAGSVWLLAIHAAAGWFCVGAPLGISLYAVLALTKCVRRSAAIKTRFA